MPVSNRPAWCLAILATLAASSGAGARPRAGVMEWVREGVQPWNLGEPLRLAQGPPDQVQLDLKQDLRLLLDERPTFTGTIVVGAIGGTLLIAAASSLIDGLAIDWRDHNGAVGANLLAGVLAVPAVVLLVVAVVMYFSARAAIAHHESRVLDLEHRIRELDVPSTVSQPERGGPALVRLEVARF